MSEAKGVWQKLSKIDVSAHIEKKAGLSYLSWAWAWGVLMENFPEANYVMLPNEVHADGSMTVHCSLTIGDVTRTMWLPVMDMRNKSIVSPSSTDINKAQMRCLTKCIAMFGLGHYIYAGEDLPASEPEKTYPEWVAEHQGVINTIKLGIANADLLAAAKAWFELDNEVKEALWRAPTKGGCFSVKEREAIRSSEFRDAYYGEKDSDNAH